MAVSFETAMKQWHHKRPRFRTTNYLRPMLADVSEAWDAVSYRDLLRTRNAVCNAI